MGTESPRLLLEEYKSLQAIFNAPSKDLKRAAQLEYMRESEYLLEGRDAYIARRIINSLSEESTGLLFIGLIHRVKRLLEKEIKIDEPEALIGSSSEALRKRVLRQEEEL